MRHRNVVWPCIIAVFGLLLVTGCTEHREGEYFFLKSEDAVMPVWVRGQMQSRDFVVYLHGGPGETSIGFASDGVFEPIEDENAFVAWDQRGAGSSQGNADSESLTTAQYVDDTRELIDLINDRFNVDRLFLVSHDYGSTIATQFLQDQENQAMVDGWVFVAGNYDLPRSIDLSREFILDFIDRQIERDVDTGKWENAREWYDEHPTIDTGEEYREHREFIEDANGIQKEDRFDRDFLDRVILSPDGGLAVEVNRTRSQRIFWDRSGSLDIDVTDQLQDIVVPTKVIWGRDDGLTPVPMAQTVIDNLGTSSADKELVILEDSAHRPFLDENEQFNDEILSFINQLK